MPNGCVVDIGNGRNVAKLGSNPVPPSDTTPPTCAISSPSSGVTASGTITVSVSASDNLGVSSVQLYVDGILRSTDSASPYTFAWDTTSVGNGSHSLMAKALDAGGNSGTSASLTINVQNAVTDTTPPVSAITSPTSGAVVSGTITPAASASGAARPATRAAHPGAAKAALRYGLSKIGLTGKGPLHRPSAWSSTLCRSASNMANKQTRTSAMYID